MLFSYLLATTLIFGKNVILVEANFPSEPIAIEAINITETTAIGTVADCQAIQVSTTATTRCGDVGVISERGIYPVNVWPNQPIQQDASKCALHCQNVVGDYYRSFGIYVTKTNMTRGYGCECYDAGVGALKLMGPTKGKNLTTTGSGIFYDSACFLVEC